MSLNSTPRANRVHIAIFGCRNAGKSSVINAITAQNIAIVSEVKGTTTDPVYKSMELLPIGPVVMIDTAGLDDEGDLGELRIKKTMEVLQKTDIAVLVTDAVQGITPYDETIIETIADRNLPLVIAINKQDETATDVSVVEDLSRRYKAKVVLVSAASKLGITELKMAIAEALPEAAETVRIIGDLLRPNDFVVLVTPIDSAAPKGRLILPQQQTVRDILESDAIAIVTKEHQLKETLAGLGKKPRFVVTDSQAFLQVAKDTPEDIPLTGFSILFARYKGDLVELVKGAKTIESLKDGDKILISEGCTHHRQSDDIGIVKIPRWLSQKTGKNFIFEHSAGTEFTEDVEQYRLIIHCGACMLNKAAMDWRIQQAKSFGVPIVNYGILIAYLEGVLERAIEPFPMAKLAWEGKI